MSDINPVQYADCTRDYLNKSSAKELFHILTALKNSLRDQLTPEEIEALPKSQRKSSQRCIEIILNLQRRRAKHPCDSITNWEASLWNHIYENFEKSTSKYFVAGSGFIRMDKVLESLVHHEFTRTHLNALFARNKSWRGRLRSLLLGDRVIMNHFVWSSRLNDKSEFVQCFECEKVGVQSNIQRDYPWKLEGEIHYLCQTHFIQTKSLQNENWIRARALAEKIDATSTFDTNVCDICQTQGKVHLLLDHKKVSQDTDDDEDEKDEELKEVDSDEEEAEEEPLVLDAGPPHIMHRDHLQMDHRNIFDKVASVITLVKTNETPEVIAREFLKCRFLCKRCHKCKTSFEHYSDVIPLKNTLRRLCNQVAKLRKLSPQAGEDFRQEIFQQASLLLADAQENLYQICRLRLRHEFKIEPFTDHSIRQLRQWGELAKHGLSVFYSTNLIETLERDIQQLTPVIVKKVKVKSETVTTEDSKTSTKEDNEQEDGRDKDDDNEEEDEVEEAEDDVIESALQSLDTVMSPEDKKKLAKVMCAFSNNRHAIHRLCDLCPNAIPENHSLFINKEGVHAYSKVNSTFFSVCFSCMHELDPDRSCDQRTLGYCVVLGASKESKWRRSEEVRQWQLMMRKTESLYQAEARIAKSLMGGQHIINRHTFGIEDGETKRMVLEVAKILYPNEKKEDALSFRRALMGVVSDTRSGKLKWGEHVHPIPLVNCHTGHSYPLFLNAPALHNFESETFAFFTMLMSLERELTFQEDIQVCDVCWSFMEPHMKRLMKFWNGLPDIYHEELSLVFARATREFMIQTGKWYVCTINNPWSKKTMPLQVGYRQEWTLAPAEMSDAEKELRMTLYAQHGNSGGVKFAQYMTYIINPIRESLGFTKIVFEVSKAEKAKMERQRLASVQNAIGEAAGAELPMMDDQSADVPSSSNKRPLDEQGKGSRKSAKKA